MFLQSLLLGAVSLIAQEPSTKAADLSRAEALHNSGLQRFAAGDVEAGRKALLESLAIHEKWGESASSIVNLRGLAFGYEGVGERQTAIIHYDRALRLARKISDKRLEASTLRDIGVLYYNIDENGRAITHLEQALALQRKLDKPATLAATIFGLGEVRRYFGQYARARADFTEALGLARESANTTVEADCLSSLAMLDVKENALPTARQRLDQALSIRLSTKDVRGEASVRARLGLYFEAAGNRAAAIESTRAAVARFVDAKNRGGEAFARQSLAMLLRKNGQPGDATQEMLLAVEAAESLRRKLADRDLRATYSGYTQSRYEFLIDTLLEVDRGDPRRSFEMSERARAREIVEALADAGVKSATQLPAPSLAAIQNTLLDADTVLLEYSLGEPASHLFIVTRTGIQHRKLRARAALEAEARRAYESYRDASRAPSNVAGLLPKDLPPHKRLLIVADGALQYVPFAHLAPGTPVTIAPSASALLALRSRPARQSPGLPLAVFADPFVPELARLPFARQEAKVIEKLASGKAFLGTEATREAVLRNPARILHFAAHSVFDSTRPDRVEIALAGGPLRLRDIQSLRLESSLVVLSACQTALGKEMKREGLLSLAQEFQRAGVAQVVASLWKVDDRATAELMNRFYEELLTRGLPAAEALRNAQRTLAASKRWAHPYYWAGFVVQGDWR